MDTNKILELISNSGLSEFAFEKQVKLAQGSVKNWRNGRNKISADALIKLADYFGVSVDYLLGRADNTTFTPEEQAKGIEQSEEDLSELEEEMLLAFRELGKFKGEEFQKMAIAYVRWARNT